MKKLLIIMTAVFAGYGNLFLSAKIQVVTTTEDLASIAREIGGEKVEALSLAKGYQDPHFVDAKPSYLMKLQKAALFIEIGKELEIGWAPSLLNSARNPKILPGAPGFLDASLHVPVLEIPTGDISRAEGDVHPFGNPHYWLDPANAKFIADSIEEKLSDISPTEASFFISRNQEFQKKLKMAVAQWESRAKELGLPGTKVVTYHKSWSYFAKRFGLEVVNFIEPRPGIPPSPQHLQRLKEQIKNQQVKLIIVDPYFDVKLPKKIAGETGAQCVVLPTSVGAEKDILTYFDLFNRQLQLISEVLKGGR